MARYAQSRIVYVSSGNVYAYAKAPGPGAAEDGALGPVGEYAQSRLGGERVAQYASRVRGTPLLIARLFYATEPRYGIIRDLADKVWQHEPIDLTMGYVNQIWQGDANGLSVPLLPLVPQPGRHHQPDRPGGLIRARVSRTAREDHGQDAPLYGRGSPRRPLGE